MAKTMITLQGPARAIASDALLEMLAGEAQRLDQELTRADRASHPKRARRAWRRIHRIGRLLQKIGWGQPLPTVSIRLDAGHELPLVIAALREALQDATDIAKDARAHGGGAAAIRANARMHDTLETLIEIEVQGIQAQQTRRQQGA